MSRDFLLFSHANGFPAACYRKFFGSLESDFRISAIDCIGHDPAYPVTDGLPHLAVQRPELFKCLILLDAPLLGYFKGTAFGMLKRLGLADRITPAHGTRARRRDWPSVEDMVAHFRRKKIFRHIDPDCLQDYAALGTVAESGRVRLLFDPEIEYRIYRSFPHDLVYYCNRLRLPAGFIGGRHSHELQQVGLAHTRRSFRVKR